MQTKAEKIEWKIKGKKKTNGNKRRKWIIMNNKKQYNKKRRISRKQFTRKGKSDIFDNTK